MPLLDRSNHDPKTIHMCKSHPSRSQRSAPLLESKALVNFEFEVQFSVSQLPEQSEPPHSRQANLNLGLLARLQVLEEGLDAGLPVQLAPYPTLCHLA